METESKTSFTSLGDVFEQMLGAINYSKDSQAGKLYPFKVRCGVVRRRPPRHEFFHWFLDMGRLDVPRVLKHEPFTHNAPMDLTFVFPERWMGVAEAYEFTHALSKHPDVDKLERVDIITSSPLLVGSFCREQILILSWDDDDDYGGE